MSDAEARKLLASVSKVVIAKGKSSRTLVAKDATLEDLRGPTGNFRAPILRKGKTLVVGFAPDVLGEML